MVYARSAFPGELDGSVFVPLEPSLLLPFHLAFRSGSNSVPVQTVLAIAEGLESSGHQHEPTARALGCEAGVGVVTPAAAGSCR